MAGLVESVELLFELNGAFFFKSAERGSVAFERVRDLEEVRLAQEVIEVVRADLLWMRLAETALPRSCSILTSAPPCWKKES